MLQKPTPVLVVDRFPALLNELLELLNSLSPEEWERPTVATNWTVRDIAIHLLGDDVTLLSDRRDGNVEPDVKLAGFEELVAWLNQRNELWIQANRRISPRLLCEFLRLTGEQINTYLGSLDPYATGVTVSWVGPDPAPVWLDLAREFTERWHHQQHIRMAVGRPLLEQPYYLAPVLAAFVRGLPRAYGQIVGDAGTAVTLTITGESGGSWSVIYEAGSWQLYQGQPPQPTAEVILLANTAWRLFTKGIVKEVATNQTIFRGDPLLGRQMLEVVSIIA